MQNVRAKNYGKIITHFFGSNLYLWMKKHSIVVIVFNSDFEGEMCRIMCTWKRMCLKEIWVEFWCFIEAFFDILLEAFPFVFSRYYLFNVVDVFEYSKLVVLNSYVVFRGDFSQLKSNFLVAMEVLNVCVSLDAHEDQNMYVWTTFQTIENGWDSNFFWM
jgi:hypothetical protein